MIHRQNHRRLISLLTLLVAVFASGCDDAIFRNDLDMLRARGELVVVTRNNPVGYYEGPYGPSGFEFELAKAFADHLGVTLRIVVLEEEAGMIDRLLNGDADIIAPGFPFGRRSARLLALGPGYLDVKQQVVGRRGGPKLDTIQHLTADLTLSITPSSARLDLLKKAVMINPEINWEVLHDYSSEEMLQMVWEQKLKLTVVESTVLALNQRYYPELLALFSLGPPQQLTWATDPANRHLHRAIITWFAQSNTRENISGLAAHYYEHLEDFDYVDLARYRRRIRNRLPRYRAFFEAAAARHDVDWKLVAALSYQESHWNPRAKSYTGVRGLMMLTRDTAETLGLEDRTDPEASIYAGVRYLARLRRMVGKEVPEPDRTLMALAAYNLGIGHLRDARMLAERLNKPADSWYGVRSVLPFLQSKKYYHTLEHGYARGTEAVQYVDRIRTYHRVLSNIIAPAEFTGYGG